VRKRFIAVLTANTGWPDSTANGGPGFRFNWIKLDNVGGSPADFALAPLNVFGDNQRHFLTVSQGKVRVFNVAGPPNPDGSCTEDWPDAFFLFSQGGTTVMIEVADHPIVDITLPT
jgi:hypothetical protein